MTEAKKPLAYPVNALDRGLRLIELVRDEGSIRVMQAAEELGVSRSSAHRLLQALVYRDLIIQDEDHGYHAGPAMTARPSNASWAKRLKLTAVPYMDDLAGSLGLATNLMIRVDWDVRFLKCVTVPGGTLDRSGSLMAAHRTAGGRALLAQLDDRALENVYRPDKSADGSVSKPALSSYSLSSSEFDRLIERVSRVRKSGFAVARAEIAQTDSAIATTIRDTSGRALGALTVSARVPVTIDRIEVERVLGPLFNTRLAIEKEFAAAS